MLITFAKELKYFHNKQCYTFLVGVQYPQQEVIKVIGQNNFDFCLRNGYFQDIQDKAVENEPQEIQETKYRFEKSKKTFKKGDQVGEKEIIDAGLIVDELLEKKVITWLK